MEMALTKGLEMSLDIEMPTSFKRLWDLLEANKITKSCLVEKTGISWRTINNMRTDGKYNGSTLEKIIDFLHGWRSDNDEPAYPIDEYGCLDKSRTITINDLMFIRPNQEVTRDQEPVASRDSADKAQA